MSKYSIINILDMIEIIGEDKVAAVLSDFSCPLNSEIENFVRKNAIDFAKRKMSITHLVINEDGKLAAVFTLTHKAVEISNEGLSASTRKRLGRFAQLDQSTNSYTVSAFLIAQFGKNLNESVGNVPAGVQLMENAVKVLQKVQHDVGGGVMYLECEDKPKLLSFYGNDKNGFRVFNERFSEADQTKYIQLLRFF
ncbi:MAG: GNAT family acetyltransferase [Clostridiales bacterium]|nr:GNAT family acetyltransferase [Clostridiales bacterium]